MLELTPEIRKEYERWLKKIGNDDPYSGPNFISIHEVIKAHFLIVDYFYQENEGLGGIGPKSLPLLHSAVSRQYVGFGHKDKWTDPLDICATLFYGLIKNHPFHDANKRTAFLVSLYHLQKLNRIPTVSQKAFEKFTVDVAEDLYAVKTLGSKHISKGSDEEISNISRFFKRNTRKLDKRYYAITYNQLDTILHKYNFLLENPIDNHIDIVRIDRRKNILGKVSEKHIKIGQVCFPSWKSIVGKGAIHTVREVTRLTPENGYDSQAFYGDADPLPSLLAHYEKPLKRLADK